MTGWWKWYTGALSHKDLCASCHQPLRTDSNIIELENEKRHLPCFLDWACVQIDARKQLANPPASGAPLTLQPSQPFGGYP